MTADIIKSKASGTVMAPPSKSMAHRYLICAGLSNGTSMISNIALSEDVKATIDCLAALGAKIVIHGDRVTVTGADPRKIETNIKAYCRESGSTLRFFIPIFLLSNNDIALGGSEYLFSRPLNVYKEICDNQNLKFILNNSSVTLKGRLTGGEYVVPGNISSQFISGLLFALPLTDNDSIIKIIPPIESRAYIDMTLKALVKFGIEASWIDDTTIKINGNQQYSPCDITVEGDYSNAAFLDAFNLIGGNVIVHGLDNDSIQGDKVYKEYFERIKNGYTTLDISNCPDLAPILMAMAAVHSGAEFIGTGRLKIKECDRGAVMAHELKKFGVHTELYDNRIIIKKREFRYRNCPIDSHNDHRIVMSFAILLSLTSGSITNCEAVNKSFPDFFEKIRSLGIGVELNND